MMYPFEMLDGHLHKRAPGGGLDGVLWVDLYRPLDSQVDMVRALGCDVPSLADMEEIEISNRLYHENDLDFMTVVLLGLDVEGKNTLGPVCFALGSGRLITVRHHAPRPFDTFPARAEKSALGCSTADHIFLGLIEEVVARLADHLEMTGRALEVVSERIYAPRRKGNPAPMMGAILADLGREGRTLSHVRLSLLTLGRALNFVMPSMARRSHEAAVAAGLNGLLRDIDAMEVHTDFLSARLGLISDAATSAINLEQNTTVRIVSVVAVLFSPPTLIASIYGMNFAQMPELVSPWGYAGSLLAMAASALIAWTFFRWRGWL
jgi:magnesium transporter